MAFLDARAVMFARTLPPWLVDTFNEITDYGRSGWFLVPLAGLILLAAALAPIAGRIANLVLRASWCGCTICFWRSRCPDWSSRSSRA